MKRGWFGAKSIFVHTNLANRRKTAVYEERVLLFLAQSADHAIRLAESEARSYARVLPGCKYLGFVDVFHAFESNVRPGFEAYSLMRESDLSPKKYLDRFHDTGKERTDRA